MLPQHHRTNGARRAGSNQNDWIRTWAGLLILVFILALMWEASVIGAGSAGSVAGDHGLDTSLNKLEQRLKVEMGAMMDESRRLAQQQQAASGQVELDAAQARIADLERALQTARTASGDTSASWQAEFDRLSAELSQARTAAAQVSQLRGDVEEAHQQASAKDAQLLALQQELHDKDMQLSQAKAASSSGGSGGWGGGVASAVAAVTTSRGGSPGAANAASQLAWDPTAWYANKPGKLLTPYVLREPLPPLIQAWRSCELDWHDLIPKHSAVWERFGESRDDKFNFMKLVMKEEMVTDYLTQYKDSGLASNFGKDFGPMRNLSACNMVDDPCLVHGLATCADNSFCEWSADTRSCRTAPAGSGEACRKGTPTKLGGFGRLTDAKPKECQRYIHERVFVEKVADDPAAMFYHWWRYFREVFSRVRNRGGLDKHNHFFMEHPPNTQFFHYFGLLSNFCWRRVESVPYGTCFCEDDVESEPVGRTDMLDHILSELQLEHLKGRPDRVTVGLISRRRKRFILNEHELVETMLDMGVDVQILPLEEMTLYEQIKALRRTTILIGIHGSGLNNAILLPRGAVLVQLLPYKLNYKGAFASVARENEVSYIEWGLDDPSKSYFHWEFLGKRELSGGRQAVLNRGSPRGGAEVYTFWINQDIIVPVDQFKDLLKRALATGSLNRALWKR